MSRPDTLTRLTIACIVGSRERIVIRITNSKGQERLRLWHGLQKIIWILRIWALPDFINGSLVITDWNIAPKQLALENENTEGQLFPKPWAMCEIVVQDIGHHTSCGAEYSVVSTAVSFKNLHEFDRFKAFLRHLISNWFEKIKVEKLSGNNTGFLVTHPAPALLYIYPNPSSNSTELSNLSSKHETTNPTKVMKVFQEVMRDDFYLTSENEVDAKRLAGKSNVERRFNPSTRPVLMEVFVFREHSFALPYSEDQRSQIMDGKTEGTEAERMDTKEMDTDPFHDDSLKVENDQLKETIRRLMEEKKREEADHREVTTELKSKNKKLTMELASVRKQFEENKEELGETLLELGRVGVQATKLSNEKEKDITFKKAFKSRNYATVSTQTLQPSTSFHPTVSPPPTETGPTTESNSQSHDRDIQGNSENYPADVSIQESLTLPSSTEGASLTNMPTSGIERSLYNNYKLLLLTISAELLSMDVNKLKTWASTEFATDHSLDINEVFRDLDQKKVIGPSDLRKLREFFERIQRIDLVYVVDHFLLGDYGPLRSMNSRRNLRNNRQRTVRGSRPASSQGTFSVPRTQSPTTSNNERQLPDPTRSVRHQGDITEDSELGEPSLMADNERETPGRVATVQPDSSKSLDTSTKTPAEDNHDEDDDDDDEQPWLCKHYKRRCSVKFKCCDKYWPCHRCHNNESNCGEKKLKSRDTQFVKCVRCGEEQQFSAASQFCSNCNLKFANYFCAICKHLTGTDDTPYHCEKCGICRVHKHRSFHCDTCGVCLDVQLRDNHSCREGSAHDECCICLEDAFTGCQILPCSHKVHKECAAKMIRSGITRCPICRQSFAHKLEKKSPAADPKKPHGKF